MQEILSKLEQPELYIKSWFPFVARNFRQKAIQINYTNGDVQVFTTPNTPHGNDKGDFKSDSELEQFAEYLKQQGHPRKID